MTDITVSSNIGEADQDTIAAAIAAATSEDTIQIMDGANSGEYYERISLGGVDKTLTFEPYATNVETITIVPGAGLDCVYIAFGSVNDISLTFTNINFQATTNTTKRCLWIRDRRNVTLTNCVLTCDSVNQHVIDLDSDPGNNTNERVITLTNCTVSSTGASTRRTIDMVDGEIVIDGGTYTVSGQVYDATSFTGDINDVDIRNATFISDGGAIIVNGTGTLANCEIIGNTIGDSGGVSGAISTKGIDIAMTSQPENPSAQSNTIDIRNNVITGDATDNSGCMGIDLLNMDMKKCVFLRIKGNTINNMASGIYCPETGELYADIQDNIINLVNSNSNGSGGIVLGENEDWYYNGNTDDNATIGGILANNIVTKGPGNGHACLIGQGWNNIYVHNNYFEGGDFGFVVKGRYNTIINNISKGDNTFYLAGARYTLVQNNTFYGIDNTGTSAGTVLIDINTTGTDPEIPYGNKIINNIIDKGDGPRALRFGTTGEHWNTIVDYNCYGGTGIIAWIDGSGKTFAQLQAIWPIYPSTGDFDDPLYFDGNSVNDINEDPLFVDVNNGDFRLKSSSPCLNTGQQPIINKSGTSQGYVNRGAWQRKSIIKTNSKGIL
jgi:hypothetical protein